MSVRTSVRVWAVVTALCLVFGAGSAGSGGFARIAKHVCSSSATHWGNCGAVVVAAADGTPLAASSPPSTALGPTQFHNAYNLPATAPGSPTIAIVDAYDDPNAEADLATYDAYYNLPPCTTANGCFRKVNQTGGSTYPATDGSWSLEISLDVQTAHEICQNCKILLVEASSASTADLGTAENEAVALGANAISNSWLAREYSSETTDELRYFHHPGVAITAASGDNGYAVGFPASSRYVIGVGGTTLNLNSSGGYGTETAWSGSGAGCSLYVPKPAWQSDTGCSRRTEADVSADADPNTGAAVFDSVSYSGQTGWFQVGGTSLASPLIAATYALAGHTSSVNDASGLYANAAFLHDVTSGNDGFCGSYLCTARAGYDGPTGLGTPNGLGAFGGSGSTPTPDFTLGASPASQSITAGGSTTYTVSMSPTGGFTGTVALSVSGLPVGANGSFSPASVSTSTPSSTLTVTSTGSVATGSYPLTITGTSGVLTHTASATLVVQSTAASDFSLGATPSSRTVTAGTAASYTISLTRTGGFSGSVSLSTSGLPNGATPGFNPATLSNTSSSTLTVSTTSALSPGSYPFTITGTSGALSHSVSATLVVQGTSQSPDFSVSVSPSSATMPSNGVARFTVTITPLGGFTGSVSLSTKPLPRGFSASFSPTSTTSTSVLTITTTNAQQTRFTNTITVTGTNGTHSHSTTISILVSS